MVESQKAETAEHKSVAGNRNLIEINIFSAEGKLLHQPQFVQMGFIVVNFRTDQSRKALHFEIVFFKHFKAQFEIDTGFDRIGTAEQTDGKKAVIFFGRYPFLLFLKNRFFGWR